jgi:hypothetical protein
MSKSLKNQIYKVRENLRVYKKVKSQVLNKVRDHIAGKVYNQVWNKVWFMIIQRSPRLYDQVKKDNE